MRCPTCDGGGKWPNILHICPVCDGGGKLPDMGFDWRVCPVCEERGTHPNILHLCPKCKGWGRLRNETGGITAFYVEAGKPRMAHLELSKTFEHINGEVLICDPYYGTGSLLRLDSLRNSGPIRFLTHEADSRERSFIGRTLKEFALERPHVEFRQTSARDLHDRYILTNEEIVILGHGLKDIGSKESFIIRLTKPICADLMRILRSSFEEKWKRAVPLT